ncbi:hypothetical protein [Frankia sp. AgPm24]|uniref:hypothetical protein n=1 Tax=Frankia sp. AgPm24 TaxID=631128 RepID=UPI00200BCEBF|nr:hypothetical protein [Frankia sp. AgPm24]
MFEAARAGPGPSTHVPPIVSWLCTDAAAGVTGRVFDARGGEVGVWPDCHQVRSVLTGDPGRSPPSSVNELDQLAPAQLLD